MLCNPEAQRKAQAEIDKVVGMSRLVDFEDRDGLPYLDAMVKEVLRWHPVLPIGIPHYSTEDDIVGKYFIPKGTIVIGNTWYLSHNESVFGPDTDKFIPERFLNPEVKYPTMAFGYGRRICPGRYFADNGLFIAIASLLQVFDILPSIDETGKEIPPVPDFGSAIFSRPVAFTCRIVPRSSLAENLLSQVRT